MGERKVYGVGFNSGGVYQIMSAPQVKSKCYTVWRDMIRRGYSSRYKEKHPTYLNVSVCEDWHDFQNFAPWFYSNYEDGFQLDKDLMKKGNKVYCPEYCRFVPKELNTVVVNQVGRSRNNELPVGVQHSRGRYVVQCNDGAKGTTHVGYFSDVQSATSAYRKFKKKRITELAEKHYWLGNIDHALYKVLLDFEVEDE